MLDFLLELLVELILEGSLEAVSSKKVPLAVRLFLAGVFFGVQFAFAGWLLYMGISEKNGLAASVGIGLLLLDIGVVYRKCKK